MSEPDVAAWTRQQIEARLSLARTAGGGEWHTGCTCKGGCHGFPPCDEVTGDDIHIYPEGGHDADQAAHVAANDPQDTIARCEAELAILDAGFAAMESGRIPEGATWSDDAAGAVVAERIIRLLASGHRHRPGYREEWKP